ncbi:MAG: hypothetical protein ACRD8W_24540 [Nitrososphaeraceae archaeon]
MTIKSRANNVIDKHMESGGDHEKGLDIFFLASQYSYTLSKRMSNNCSKHDPYCTIRER